MKRTVVFCVLMVVLGLLACQQPSQPIQSEPPLSPTAQFYQDYDRDVDEVLTVSNMLPNVPSIRGWRQDLQNLKPYLERELPQLQGKTLHVVLQQHDEFAEMGEQKQTTAASQTKTMEALNQIHPRLLSIEGSYLDKFTKESFIAALDKSAAEAMEVSGGGQKPSNPGDNEPGGFNWFLNRNAVLKYGYEHSDCHTIGGEWRGVHMLDAVMMAPNAPPPAQHAFHTASRIRSWNTAARVGEFMRRDGLSEGTIVIGSWHRPHFELLEKLFGVRVIFHETQ
jgi:hypothetical protein